MERRNFDSLITACDFKRLFVGELGWNKPKGNPRLFPFTIEETSYNFTCVAERSGFQILTIEVESFPTVSLLKRIDSQLRRQAQDYIAIFKNSSSKSHHLWVIPIPKVNKRDLVNLEYTSASKSDFIFQKLEMFTFNPEEETTILDVKDAVHRAFSINSEKITKDFYIGFQKEHSAFANLITGIDDNLPLKDNRTKQWYASVMLNRLMFCYFIQKKGFLDGNINYLRNKLEWVRKEKGENRFYSTFYKGFLKELFSDGLNTPKHSFKFEKMFGRIPYLNGGMFDSHQIEREYTEIEIPDDAFISLFSFFDKWQWHLDTRVTASGKDINPDVLGYIFEQYINDRAQMGAYYTKEDITEYIGRNTILPFLLDKINSAEEKWIWEHLAKSGDKYLFEGLKHGHCEDWKDRIPKNISDGLNTYKNNLLERRIDWNSKTPQPWGLPTEIWRETIERLQRCDRILSKLQNREISSVNDFITYNLDIRQFVLDLISHPNASQNFLYKFYEALLSVTILDPTCGSGAFLFAAMNILEPLYYECIMRLESFPQEVRIPEVVKVLEETSKQYRSNIHYYIYKSIILRNLYGVDIMAEATEIAKLRLFLKLVSVVDVDYLADNLGLDPLPDIDFNIHCGNSLVGYANEKEIIRDLSFAHDIMQEIANQELKDKIEQQMRTVAFTYNKFKAHQMNQEKYFREFKEVKTLLKSRLDELNNTLNRRLFLTTGLNENQYQNWFKSHQPFHWIAEYYQIIHDNGGFDVVIGNPPYVVYNESKSNYKIGSQYKSLSSANLYAFTVERSYELLASNYRLTMIIPMSIVASKRTSSLREVVKTKANQSHIINLAGDWHPGRLFEGVRSMFSILMSTSNAPSSFYTTDYLRFYNLERSNLFNTKIVFTPNTLNINDPISKISSEIENEIFKKIVLDKGNLLSYITPNPDCHSIFYRNAGIAYYHIAINFEQHFKINGVKTTSTTLKSLTFPSKKTSNQALAILNSSLFYWFFCSNSDCYHLTINDITRFSYSLDEIDEYSSLINALMEDIREHSIIKDTNYKTKGLVQYQEFYPRHSKSIIDKIDAVLAKHFNLTEEELDFIINYDIKYRMGDELNNDDE